MSRVPIPIGALLVDPRGRARGGADRQGLGQQAQAAIALLDMYA